MAAPSSTATHRQPWPRPDRVMFSAGSFWAFWPKRWMPFPPPPLPFGCMVPRPPVLERAFWRRICPTCCRLCCANWSKPLHEYLAADSQPSFSGRRRQHTCVYPDDPRAARASTAVNRHRLGARDDRPALSRFADVFDVWAAQTAAQGLAALRAKTRREPLGERSHRKLRIARILTGADRHAREWNGIGSGAVHHHVERGVEARHLHLYSRR